MGLIEMRSKQLIDKNFCSLLRDGFNVIIFDSFTQHGSLNAHTQLKCVKSSLVRNIFNEECSDTSDNFITYIALEWSKSSKSSTKNGMNK